MKQSLVIKDQTVKLYEQAKLKYFTLHLNTFPSADKVLAEAFKTYLKK